MKQTYTLVILLLLSCPAFCQTSGFTLTFEDTAVIHQVFYTDSILDPAGIWQIGKPNKPLFDSAYNSTNAVVTLLDSALPPNTRASFILKTNPSQYIFTSLSFEQKADFDSAHSGGYVQYSIDTGHNWYNTTDYASQTRVHAPNLVRWAPEWDDNFPLDTLPGDIPYITGNTNGWDEGYVLFPCNAVLKTNQYRELWFKFTVFSDSTSSGYHAGWIIDSIIFRSGQYECSGINEINSSHLNISPNPLSNGYTISLTDESDGEYSVMLYDLMGRKMMEQDFAGRDVTLWRNGLAAGSYVIRVMNRRTKDTFDKRVVME